MVVLRDVSFLKEKRNRRTGVLSVNGVHFMYFMKASKWYSRMNASRPRVI